MMTLEPMIQTLDSQPAAETSPTVQQVLSAPVFIVGAPRSGTTWLQKMLLAHPAVCGGQESHFFATFGPVMRKWQAQSTSHRGAGLVAYFTAEQFHGRLLDWWNQTFRQLVEQKPTARVLLEKTPEHAKFVPEILQLLPHARFIHMVRDSRSVVASLLAASRSEWGRHWAPRTARHAAIVWWDHVRQAREAGASLGNDRYLEVFYEDLRRDPAASLRRVFAFLGVEASDQQVSQVVSAERFDGPNADANGLGAAAEPTGFVRKGEIDGWRRELTLPQKLTVWRFTRRQMKALGYTWKGRP